MTCSAAAETSQHSRSLKQKVVDHVFFTFLQSFNGQPKKRGSLVKTVSVFFSGQDSFYLDSRGTKFGYI